jgi:hypothetical protein
MNRPHKDLPLNLDIAYGPVESFASKPPFL